MRGYALAMVPAEKIVTALVDGRPVYYLSRSPVLVVLLCGRDKSSQRRDIARAEAMARDWTE